LTPLGRRLLTRVQPIWAALMEAARDLEREGIDLLTPIDRIERSLDRRPILERALAYLAPDP
jgi:MarR family transcriptional regulator, organic hydroperoxide resistance regulator